MSSGHASSDTLVGAWILDQYRIVRVLAEGGMGRVYLAEQTAMDRYAAIKILSARATSHQEWRGRFRQEARAASRLAHPNIITVYNFGELEDGSLFLAMEYVEGDTLAELLARTRMPVGVALDVGWQCATALAHAHKKQVVHRDFKPENVMVARESGDIRVRVLDFGIARLVEESELTQTGELLGTPRYLSPEQCRGESATAKSDQYALGLVLYEMLAGSPAIAADSAFGYLHRHQNTMPEPLASLRDDALVEQLSPAVMRMLAKEPDDRFSTMSEVCAQLESFAREAGDQEFNGQLRRPRTGEIELQRFATIAQPTIESAEQPAETAPIPVTMLGGSALAEQAAQLLSAEGFRLTGRLSDPGQLAVHRPRGALALVSLAHDRWRQQWETWRQGGAVSERSVACIDAPLTTERLEQAVQCFDHLMLGPHPLDPAIVSAALSWIGRPKRSGLQHLRLGSTLQTFHVSSSRHKGSLVDAMVEDARTASVRRQTLHAMTEIAEEMIMNAIFHAPVDKQGVQRYADLDRSVETKLAAGEEAVFSWSVSEQRIALSIRDPFGSLPPSEALRRITGPRPRRGTPMRKTGMGMGLRIIARAANHVMIAIAPGRWCEVLAVIDRKRSSDRSVFLTRHAAHTTHRVGDRLRLRERSERDTTRIEMLGEINETSDLVPLFSRSGSLRLDLSGIERINSMGIRNWMDAAMERPAGLEISFERCSQAFVRQLNLIPALTEMGSVKSLMAPFFCASCDSEREELIDIAELDEKRVPTRKCDHCGAPMSLDAPPEEYFAFRFS